VDVISDEAWKEIAGTDRSVIVYGNASINAAWKELLLDCPVVVERDSWQVPGEEAKTEAAILMIRPRPGSAQASVGAIGGTDLRSMQATNRLPIFSSGTGYPDLLIIGPDYLERGVEAVRLTGYFGHDWSFETGEWAQPATTK
jgi:hypothetical protein